MVSWPGITFPAPPLKFRTAGFPRYGFKLDFDRDLRRRSVGLRAGPPCPQRPPTYTRPESRTRPEGGVPRRHGTLARPSGSPGHPQGRSSPEALGSPTGYVVPPGHRLLWPHPTLSAPPAGLSSSSWRVSARRACLGWSREAPQFAPRVALSVPSSVPRRTGRLHLAVASPPALAFAISASARHPRRHHRRFPGGQRNEAATFASSYGPEGCSPCPGQGFYARAFTSPSHLNEASSMTTRATANSRGRTSTG